ncbi:MAG: hypothetical protein AAGJ81_01565 [Verrucomicrobiota bacterium]
MAISTDDVKDLPHIVIVENEGELKLFEYERGQMEQAHKQAQDYAMRNGGRAIVAVRVRQCGDFKYLSDHNCV